MAPKGHYLTQHQRLSIVLWKRESEPPSDGEIARRVGCARTTVMRCQQKIRVFNESCKESLFAKQQRGRPWNRPNTENNDKDDNGEKQPVGPGRILTERQWFEIVWLKQENKLSDEEIARKVGCRLRSVRDEWNKWSKKRTSFNRKSQQKHQQLKKAGDINEEKATDHSTKKRETVEENPLAPIEVKQELRVVVTEEGDGSFTPPTAFMGPEGEDNFSEDFISVTPGEEAQFFQSGSTSLNETGNGMEISHQEDQMQSNSGQNSTFGGSRKRGRQEKNNSNNNGPPRKQRLASSTALNGDGKTLAKRLQEILGIKNPGEVENTSENHLIDAVLQLKQRAETLEKQNTVLIGAITTIKEAIPRDFQPPSAAASFMMPSSSNNVANEEREQNSSSQKLTSTTSIFQNSSAPANNGMRTFLNTMWEAVVRSNESGSA